MIGDGRTSLLTEDGWPNGGQPPRLPPDQRCRFGAPGRLCEMQGRPSKDSDLAGSMRMRPLVRGLRACGRTLTHPEPRGVAVRKQCAHGRIPARVWSGGGRPWLQALRLVAGSITIDTLLSTAEPELSIHHFIPIFACSACGCREWAGMPVEGRRAPIPLSTPAIPRSTVP